MKLEEQEEKSNTLGQVNSVLRDQLDKAGQNNAALVGDLKRLANDWDKLNRELVHRVRNQGDVEKITKLGTVFEVKGLHNHTIPHLFTLLKTQMKIILAIISKYLLKDHRKIRKFLMYLVLTTQITNQSKLSFSDTNYV